MGASPLMSIGMRAMSASYAAIQVTGHNIANANVDGYSRQQAQLATSKGQYTGAGFFGKGVDVTTVSRLHDQFLTKAATSARSLAEMDATRAERLGQLEKLFPTGGTGLGYSVGTFLNAMVDLASRPSDNATREVALARTQDVATRFAAVGSQLDGLQANVTADLKTTIAAINGITSSLAQVNDRIAASRGLGHAPNDLLDERDRLLSQLAEKIQFSSVVADDGAVGVFVAGGQSLVLGTTATKMQVTTDPLDVSRAAVALADGDKLRLLDEDGLGGGSVAALLQFQNTDLVDARNRVGQLAAAVASAVNGQQQLGLDLNGDAGKPLFATGAPKARPATDNARDPATGAYRADIRISTPDGTVLKAADYQVRVDPATPDGFLVTRLGDPEVTTPVVAVGGKFSIDGMDVEITGNPASTDRFVLQPVAAAAGGMTALIRDPRLVAAASPLVSRVPASNTGTASVASLTMVAPPTPGSNATVDFATDPATGRLQYTWTVTDAAGVATTSAPRDWNDDGVVPPQPDDIAGARLKLAGVPKPGDSIAIDEIEPAYVRANNGNALALSALRDAMIVGRDSSGGVYSGGQLATDAYAAAMSDVAVRVQTSKAAESISGAVASQAELVRSEVAGVNLDEEAARLIQYQQSYQAAAKVLQIAQSIFETLLKTAGA